MRKRTEIVVCIALMAADQVLKAVCIGLNQSLIPGILGLRWTENHGFSLGLFSNAHLAALLISLAVIIPLLVCWCRLPKHHPLQWPLTLVTAGAVSNLADRLILGFVRDMFELLFVRFYIFNLADVCVTGGALWCAVVLLRYPDREAA